MCEVMEKYLEEARIEASAEAKKSERIQAIRNMIELEVPREKILKKTFAKSSIIWYHMLISLRSVRHRLLLNTVRVLRKS